MLFLLFFCLPFFSFYYLLHTLATRILNSIPNSSTAKLRKRNNILPNYQTTFKQKCLQILSTLPHPRHPRLVRITSMSTVLFPSEAMTIMLNGLSSSRLSLPPQQRRPMYCDVEYLHHNTWHLPQGRHFTDRFDLSHIDIENDQFFLLAPWMQSSASCSF